MMSNISVSEEFFILESVILTSFLLLIFIYSFDMHTWNYNTFLNIVNVADFI